MKDSKRWVFLNEMSTKVCSRHKAIADLVQFQESLQEYDF